MVYEGCPLFGYETGFTPGLGTFYLNWVFVAIIFSLIFWSTYYLLIKKNKIVRRKK